MSDRKASRTALGAAYMRAVHQLFDAQPRILDDPFALSLQPALFSEFNIFNDFEIDLEGNRHPHGSIL
jgi:O-methyltransferase involved in polyketide biosynthesis